MTINPRLEGDSRLVGGAGVPERDKLLDPPYRKLKWYREPRWPWGR